MNETRFLTSVGLALAAIGLGLGHRSLAGEKEIVLQDHIKLQWSNELVTFPFEAAKGECHRDSVTVQGPKGPVACQLSDILYWSGSTEFVQSAKLSFIVDLAPLATDRFTVRYGTKATEGPQADLAIKPSEGHVEITTTQFGVRLLLGRKQFSTPVHSAKVPGPIVAMSHAHGSDRRWFHASRMYGSKRLAGYSAELTEAGAVFSEVTVRYTYEDGNTLDLTFQVAAGDSGIFVDAHSKKDDPSSGWHMVVTDPSRPLVWRMVTERTNTNPWPGMPECDEIDTWIDIPLARAPAGTVSNLSPWSDWWSDDTQTRIRLRLAGQNRELWITRRDAGIWVTPAPTGKSAQFGEYGRKKIPLVRAESGELYLQVDNAKGWRKWAVGTLPPLGPIPDEIRQQARPDQRALPGDVPSPTTEYPGQAYLSRYEVLRHGHVGRHLNEVKDWVLDWQVKTEHPHVYVNRAQLLAVQKRGVEPKLLDELLAAIHPQTTMRSNAMAGRAIGAYLLTGRKDIAQKYNLVGMLDDLLGRLGVMDTWRTNGFLSSFYDAIMGSDLLTPKQRKLFQARFAYLCYRSADPATWSMERGYCSGNLNMSVANNTLLGIIACTIPDHPMAEQWIAAALAMTEEMLATKVGPAGEWPESIANYAHVSSTPLLLFAMAAKNAGKKDYVNDERMKRLLMFLTKQYTPPDPRHTETHKGGVCSLLPPIGRGPAGEAYGLHGAMARATAESDPEYSNVLQWVWMRGQPRRVAGNHLLGWEWVCMDPGLPAAAPDWRMDVFPQLGVLMRHGFSTPHAWYAHLLARPNYIVPTESGTMPIVFAKGVPISARGLNSYPDREELLLSRVLPARRRGDLDYRAVHYSHQCQGKVVGFSDLPRQQYVVGDYTIDDVWSRMDFQRPPKAVSQHHWRLLPEWPEVPGEGSPGVKWRRQVLFPHADDPAGVGYFVLRDTISGSGGGGTMWQFWTVSEKLGTPAEAADRKRFLADAPGNETLAARRLTQGNHYTAVGPFGLDVEFYIAAPTHTPRNTLRYGTTQVMTSNQGFSEYQDLLHLQRPDDGAYFVVIYPRRQCEEVPQFSTLGDGKVIKITGKFGTDYSFLSETLAKVSAEDASFDGTAGSIQDRRSGLVLSLGAEGCIQYKRYAITSDVPAAVRVEERALTVSFTPWHDRASVLFQAPGRWRVSETVAGVKLDDSGSDQLRLAVPTGVRSVRLTQR